MECGTCGNPMVPLFLTCVCDYCENPAKGDYHRGYIVYRGFLGPGFPHYVFSNHQSAERWQRGQGQQNSGEIREILSSEPFRWRPSRGTLQDIEFADHLFEIFPDHRYRVAPHRAFLAPVAAG